MQMQRLMSVAAVILFFLIIGFTAFSQTDTISARSMAAYATAHNNNYFLPLEVLKHSAELGLTKEQVSKLKVIQATLKLKERETEVSNIRNEKMLDSLFRKNILNEGVIIFYTNRYGLYAGEYRGAVLLACYNTRLVLTSLQLKKLIALQHHS